MYFLPHIYGTTDLMISIDTAETDEFIDNTSAVRSDFSEEIDEFARTHENNMEIPHDASSTFDLYLYLLSKIEEYS